MEENVHFNSSDHIKKNTQNQRHFQLSYKKVKVKITRQKKGKRKL